MKLIFFLFVLFISGEIFARPQYAVRRKLIDCMSCHFNPSGGGARNVYGKAFGFRQNNPGVYSTQDLFSVDYRAINIQTAKQKNENPNGTGMMTSNVTGAIPVVSEEDGSAVYAVASYDFGGFAQAPRETYARFTGKEKGVLLFGRFNIPFGLLTDEHRAYVRKMTKTDLNVFEMGAMYSNTPVSYLHYDFAMVEGYQKNGAYPDTGNNYGMVANIRTNFNKSPIMLGVSGLYNKGQIDSNTNTIRSVDPWALALYTGFSLDHLTNKAVLGSFTAEVTYAHNFNRPEYNSNIGYFVSSTNSPTYFAEIQDKHSVGLMTRLELDLTAKWTLFYKIDAFAPDQEHMKDLFLLNTVGMKLWYNSNVDLDFRFEKTEIRRDGLEETGVSAAMDKALILGRIWI